MQRLATSEVDAFEADKRGALDDEVDTQGALYDEADSDEELMETMMEALLYLCPTVCSKTIFSLFLCL